MISVSSELLSDVSIFTLVSKVDFEFAASTSFAILRALFLKCFAYFISNKSRTSYSVAISISRFSSSCSSISLVSLYHEEILTAF